MIPQSDFSKLPTDRPNLEASRKYAELLAEQIPRYGSSFCRLATELALLAQKILEAELSISQEKRRTSPTEQKVLLEAACARLGYRLVPEVFSIKHYLMEITTTDTYERVVSCPSVTAPESYTIALFTNEPRFRSCKVIRELDVSEAETIIQEQRARRRGKREVKNALSLLERATSDSFNATTEELEVVELAEKSGALEAYKSVIRRHYKMLQRTPPTETTMGLMFISFLRTLAKLELSQESMNSLRSEFHGVIDVYQSNGTAMILSDGEIRWFCIAAELKNHHKKSGVAPLRLGGKTIVRRNTLTDPTLRTKHGYVPSNAHIFLEALLHYGAGDPRREMRPISIRPEEK
jgi:hypothetical protein